MTDTIMIALLGLAGVVLTVAGGLVGAAISARSQRRTAQLAATATLNASKATAEQLMIDQLQEELAGYRSATDVRLDRLERENRAYRAFIFVQRDHMVDNGIKPPAWPEDLPR